MWNGASRVKNIFPDLVEGDDIENILLSDVASSDDKSMDSTNDPVQVTPLRLYSEDTKVDTPRLGNMYGLMSILSPTANKSGGVTDDSSNNKNCNSTNTDIITKEEKITEKSSQSNDTINNTTVASKH